MTTHALTLSQPWATLVVEGMKQIESRSWGLRADKRPTHLAIHAGKGIDRHTRAWITEPHSRLRMTAFCEPYRAALRQAGYSTLDPWQKGYGYVIDGAQPLHLGAIVGVVRLVDIVPADEVTRWWKQGTISETEYRLGDYAAGRFGWLLSEPVAFEQPIYCPGALGLWKLTGPVRCEVLAAHAMMVA